MNRTLLDEQDDEIAVRVPRPGVQQLQRLAAELQGLAAVEDIVWKERRPVTRPEIPVEHRHV